MYPIWILWLCFFSFFSFFLRLDFIILSYSHKFINFTLRRSDYEKFTSFDIGKFISIIILIFVLVGALFLRDSSKDQSQYDRLQFERLVDEKIRDIMNRIEYLYNIKEPSHNIPHKEYDEKFNSIQSHLDHIKSQLKSFDNQKITEKFNELSKQMEQLNEQSKSLENRVNDIDPKSIMKEFNETLKKEVILLIQDYIEKNDIIKDKDHLPHSDDILKFIKEALRQYDADRIAKRDYANRKYGAYIIDYNIPNSWSSVVGDQGILSKVISLLPFSKVSNPEEAIDSDLSAGSCWSFPGSKASLTIHLYKRIIPTEFTIDHIDESIASNIQSSPKDVKVYGIDDDRNEILLGQYSYKIDNTESNIQTFKAIEQNKFFDKIKLVIESNHGHDYTCLYRFRVHGKEY